MATRTYSSPACLPNRVVAAMKRTHLGPDAYDLLISHEDADVLKPDGSLLLAFRHRVLPADVCQRAYPSLFRAAVLTDNRGMAAGGERVRPVKKDGTVSKRTRSRPVLSGLVGYFDRTQAQPYCRQTTYTRRDVEGWQNVQPFIRAVNGVFAQHCPERYAAQREVVERTPPEWVIPGTVFTTVTVNRSWATAVHKDEGDLPQGFGVMSVLREGTFKGCYLCWPKYRVAVDLHTCDVVLADVHEWHGNTPLIGEAGGYERISTIFYYRTRMRECGSAAAELAQAKRRPERGGRLYEPRGEQGWLFR